MTGSSLSTCRFPAGPDDDSVDPGIDEEEVTGREEDMDNVAEDTFKEADGDQEDYQPLYYRWFFRTDFEERIYNSWNK